MLTCLGVATLLLTPSSIAGSLRVRYSRTKKEELTKYALYLPVIRDRDSCPEIFSLPSGEKMGGETARQTGPIRRCPMRCPPAARARPPPFCFHVTRRTKSRAFSRFRFRFRRGRAGGHRPRHRRVKVLR